MSFLLSAPENEILTFRRSDPTRIGKWFKASEFDCKNCVCQRTIIHTQLIRRLDTMRDILGKPIFINSGYRCERQQALLRIKGYETSNKVSQHELGRAADIGSHLIKGKILVPIAIQAGFHAIGESMWWIHVDLRDDMERRWQYIKRVS